ncbi:hypothetical protein ON010_g18682 [Phytophthora cinnamomi]|nr:hypothetical protein ON010_g18682 [Phytophthora cinnamomi]
MNGLCITRIAENSCSVRSVSEGGLVGSAGRAGVADAIVETRALAIEAASVGPIATVDLITVRSSTVLSVRVVVARAGTVTQARSHVVAGAGVALRADFALGPAPSSVANALAAFTAAVPGASLGALRVNSNDAFYAGGRQRFQQRNALVNGCNPVVLHKAAGISGLRVEGPVERPDRLILQIRRNRIGPLSGMLSGKFESLHHGAL